MGMEIRVGERGRGLHEGGGEMGVGWWRQEDEWRK